MKLSELVDNLDYQRLVNFDNVEINGISYDSKTTEKGDIFVCMVGEYSDGHQYYKSALDKGAVALMVEKVIDCDAPQILVKSTRHRIADISDRFYSHPSHGLNLIGVTGTNGKTTVTHLIQKIVEANFQKCALIGTLGYKLSCDDKYKEAKHTTPQAPELQATLRLIKDIEKIKNVAMEVSSHALEQNRVGGCEYNGAVLTNLTQDHLDYHITMDNYFDAKAILFKGLKSGTFAVINRDDDYAERFLSIIPSGVRVLTYGVKNSADIMATNIDFSRIGAKFSLKTPNGECNVSLHMNGMFSVYNVLAAISVAVAQDIDVSVAVKSLEKTTGVAGRFEIVAKTPLVIVDYAHTPDGLENVLKAAREITPNGAKLVCLFGCGGDRDSTKRPKMGAIAEEFADKVVITSDNPRSEDPQQIITDILTGLKSVSSVIVEPDRGKAIELLPSLVSANDVVLIAGKGHENYQILADRTIHFDDREEAGKAFLCKI